MYGGALHALKKEKTAGAAAAPLPKKIEKKKKKRKSSSSSSSSTSTTVTHPKTSTAATNKKTKTMDSTPINTTERSELGDEDYAQIQSIDYLQVWHEDRAAWKFNKNRQVWLLQHMFHPSSVDKTSFKILLKYLEGLKGAARQKTLKQAQKILEEGVEVHATTTEVTGVDPAVLEKQRKSTEKLRRIRYGRADALAKILA